MTRRELVLTWLGLVVLCALVFAPHVRHGGFYLDDWSNAAASLQPPGGPSAGNALSFLAKVGIYRPVLVLYVPLTYWAFGMHMALHIAWAATLAVLVAGMLYGVLRTLGVPRIHAWAIAALTIVYPWSDSTRLWPTADQVSLSVMFALAGLWIALAGLSGRTWRWHCFAGILYLLSILTYEVTLPLIAVAGGIYVARVGWRAARVRWGIDLVAVIAGGLWVGTHTVRTKSSLSGDLDHLQEIVKTGGTIAGRTLLPVGAQRTTLALGLLLGVLLLGLAAYACRPERFRERGSWGLRSWLLMAGGGLLAAALGWVMFIPADPYYTPSIFGMTNRVNGLAGVGLVIALYGALGVVGVLVGQLRPRASIVAVAITLLLGGLIGISYIHVIRRHTQIWDTAYIAEKTGLQEIRKQFPQLPHSTTLFVSGYPAYQTLGVPIFSTTWDLDGMIKTQYEDWTLSAYPVLAETQIVCHPDGIRLEGLGSVGPLVPYGHAQFFDFATHRRAHPDSSEACRAVAASYAPGPLYLSTSY